MHKKNKDIMILIFINFDTKQRVNQIRSVVTGYVINDTVNLPLVEIYPLTHRGCIRMAPSMRMVSPLR